MRIFCGSDGNLYRKRFDNMKNITFFRLTHFVNSNIADVSTLFNSQILYSSLQFFFIHLQLQHFTSAMLTISSVAQCHKICDYSSNFSMHFIPYSKFLYVVYKMSNQNCIISIKSYYLFVQSLNLLNIGNCVCIYLRSKHPNDDNLLLFCQICSWMI